jgi:hypothetical protein
MKERLWRRSSGSVICTKWEAAVYRALGADASAGAGCAAKAPCCRPEAGAEVCRARPRPPPPPPLPPRTRGAAPAPTGRLTFRVGSPSPNATMPGAPAPVSDCASLTAPTMHCAALSTSYSWLVAAGPGGGMAWVGCKARRGAAHQEPRRYSTRTAAGQAPPQQPGSNTAGHLALTRQRRVARCARGLQLPGHLPAMLGDRPALRHQRHHRRQLPLHVGGAKRRVQRHEGRVPAVPRVGALKPAGGERRTAGRATTRPVGLRCQGSCPVDFLCSCVGATASGRLACLPDRSCMPAQRVCQHSVYGEARGAAVPPTG